MSQRKRDFITRKYYEYNDTVADMATMLSWYTQIFMEV